MKKFLAIVLTSLFVLVNIAKPALGLVTAPVVSADSVVLMDATTGSILYEKNKNSAYPPASTTKIMTVLLVLQNSNLDDIVTVSKNAAMTDGSRIYLIEGEKLPVKELLYGLILASANDCAVALAEHISGTSEKFALLMNKKANSLGCKSTNFVNPNGLYDVNHKTSAYDLALIMQELTKQPDYKVMSTTPSYMMAPTNKSSKTRPLWNGNRLIHKEDQYYYANCVGGKTGYTVQSKHSYIAVASKNGQKLIVALVHDSKKTFFPDSIKLLDYGFNNFELSKYFNKDQKVSDLKLKDGTLIPLLASKDFYIVKPKNSSITPNIKTEQKKSDFSSIAKGDEISIATINFGKDSYNLNLSSGVSYSNPSSLSTGLLNGDLKSSKTFYNLKTILKYFVIILVVLIVFLRLRRLKRKRKKRFRRYINYLNNKR